MSKIEQIEVTNITDAQRDEWRSLVRSAMAICNESVAGRELAGSDFAHALAQGRATIDFRLELPTGRAVAVAHWPELDSGPVELFRLMPGRRFDA